MRVFCALERINSFFRNGGLQSLINHAWHDYR